MASCNGLAVSLALLIVTLAATPVLASEPASLPTEFSATPPASESVFFYPSLRLDVGVLVNLGGNHAADVTTAILGGVLVGFKRVDLTLIAEAGYQYGHGGPQHLGSAGVVLAYGHHIVDGGVRLHALIGSEGGAFAAGGSASGYVGFFYESLFVDVGWQTVVLSGTHSNQLRVAAGVNLPTLLTAIFLNSFFGDLFQR